MNSSLPLQTAMLLTHALPVSGYRWIPGNNACDHMLRSARRIVAIAPVAATWRVPRRILQSDAA